MSEALQPATWRPQLPTTLDDRYALEAEVEVFAYGVHYAGRDLALDEAVSVTVFHPAFFAEPVREANVGRLGVAARHRHPHLAAVRAVHVDEGAAWIVCDPAVGVPLTMWRREPGEGADGAYRLVGQLLDALATIHRQGIHGAIGPSTVRIVEGHAWLSHPFRLVWPDDPARLGLPPLRAAWLAPEQQHDPAPEGPATDVYSVGLVLGYLLARGLTEPGHSLMIQGIDVAPGVDEVYVRATARQVELRYATVAELRAALEAAAGAPWAQAQVVVGAPLFELATDHGAPGVAPSTEDTPADGVALPRFEQDVDRTVEEEGIPAEIHAFTATGEATAVPLDAAEVLDAQSIAEGPPPLPLGITTEGAASPEVVDAVPLPPPLEDLDAADASSAAPQVLIAPDVEQVVVAALPPLPPPLPSDAALFDTRRSKRPGGAAEGLAGTEDTALEVAAIDDETLAAMDGLVFGADHEGDPAAGGPAPAGDVNKEAGADVEASAERTPPKATPPVGPPGVEDTGERIALAAKGASWAVGAKQLSEAVRTRSPIERVVTVLPEAPEPAPAALATAANEATSNADDERSPGASSFAAAAMTARDVGAPAAAALGGGGVSGADIGEGPAPVDAPLSRGGASEPRASSSRVLIIAAVLLLVAGGLFAALFLGGEESTPERPVGPDAGALASAADVAGGGSAGVAPGADAGSRGADTAPASPGAGVDALTGADDEDATGTSTDEDGAEGGASVAGADIEGPGDDAASTAAVVAESDASAVAAVAASPDAGVSDPEADDTLEGDTGTAPERTPDVAAPAEDTAAPAPTFVATDWRALDCPAGMAKIRRKIQVEVRGERFDDWEVHCIDRYESPGAGQLPQVDIDLAGARAACAGRGKRLCTRAEWRRACGAKYPYGGTYDPDACNTLGEDGMPKPLVPSGSKARCKGGWGTFDMVGNAAEWTSDGFVNGGSAYRHGEAATCGQASRRAGGHAYVSFRCCADAK